MSVPWGTNAQSNVYWSSTPNADVPSDALAMDLFSREALRLAGAKRAVLEFFWRTALSFVWTNRTKT